MQVAICEDNIQIMSDIEKLIVAFFKENKIEYDLDTYLSGERMIEYLTKETDYKYHLYLLDIEMGEVNGINIAKQIREKDKDALIIFITSHDEFMPNAFDVSAFHYLIKPVDTGKLKEVLKKAISTIKRKNNLFIYQTNKKTFALLYSNIQYFESDKRKMKIITNSTTYSFYGTMKEIEKTLPSHFATIHKSFLINLEHVELVEGRMVRMDNGHELVISRSNLQNFYKIYRRFILEKVE